MSILIRLFLTFAKIGALGFGGGMAILALIYQSMQQFGNIDAAEFAELFGHIPGYARSDGGQCGNIFRI